MGGEATWRFALHQPDTFAAIAPWSAYLNHADAATMKSIKDLPVWVIHDVDDTVFPLGRAQQPVDALKEAGGRPVIAYTFGPAARITFISNVSWILKNCSKFFTNNAASSRAFRS